MRRGMFAWDRGLDFEKVRAELVERLRKAERPLDRARLVVLLTALTNGARLSEALEAVVKFTGKREVEVAVRKRKGVRRKVVFPVEIDNRVLAEARDALAVLVREHGLRVVMKRLSAWTCEKAGFNPHSLRYAFVGWLARQGVPAQVVAKITGHAKLDFILHYTQAAVAEEVLRQVASGWGSKISEVVGGGGSEKGDRNQGGPSGG